MKQQSRHARRMKDLAHNKQTNFEEGKWKISFVFDGIEHKVSHKLSPGEVKHMKDLCIQFGDEGAQQVIWRAAIKGVSVVSENIMAKAALDYIAKYYQGPIRTGDPSKTRNAVVYEDVVDKNEVHEALSSFLESTKPLVEEKAFDPVEREKIEQQIMGEGLT